MATMARTREGAALVGFAGVTAVAAILGGRATRRGRSRWYPRLDKPPFQPPAWIFGPVWTTLYGLIAASGWRVYRRVWAPHRQRALALWGTQLGLNALWPYLFFGKRRPRAALVDSALLLANGVAYVHVARRVDAPAARMFVPYVGWVGFAT